MIEEFGCFEAIQTELEPVFVTFSRDGNLDGYAEGDERKPLGCIVVELCETKGEIDMNDIDSLTVHFDLESLVDASIESLMCFGEYIELKEKPRFDRVKEALLKVIDKIDNIPYEKVESS